MSHTAANRRSTTARAGTYCTLSSSPSPSSSRARRRRHSQDTRTATRGHSRPPQQQQQPQVEASRGSRKWPALPAAFRRRVAARRPPPKRGPPRPRALGASRPAPPETHTGRPPPAEALRRDVPRADVPWADLVTPPLARPLVGWERGEATSRRPQHASHAARPPRLTRSCLRRVSWADTPTSRRTTPHLPPRVAPSAQPPSAIAATPPRRR